MKQEKGQRAFPLVSTKTFSSLDTHRVFLGQNLSKQRTAEFLQMERQAAVGNCHLEAGTGDNELLSFSTDISLPMVGIA